jgi:hypothetical protein
MAESTDQRIQKILRNKAKEKEADDLEKKLAKDQSNERQETAERVKQKWTADTYVIAEILKDFEQKMSALELQLTFQDAGQKGNALAVGRISGRISGRDLQVTLNVHLNGGRTIPLAEIDRRHLHAGFGPTRRTDLHLSIFLEPWGNCFIIFTSRAISRQVRRSV